MCAHFRDTAKISKHTLFYKSVSLFCLWSYSQLIKKNPWIPPLLWVHPTRLEKQVSIHLSQQPLHTARIPVLKPSTWQLINNWLTCFSGELDDLHQAPRWLRSQREIQQKLRRDDSLVKPQTAINSCISPSGMLQLLTHDDLDSAFFTNSNF